MEMTLGDIIKVLEDEIVRDGDRIIPLGFTTPHSYRGYYDQLAFEPAAGITIGGIHRLERRRLHGAGILEFARSRAAKRAYRLIAGEDTPQPEDGW